MKLSIVIVSYNTKELLADCLNSIKSAQKHADTEIFVVDNNSQDGTVDHLNQYFQWVKLIVNRKNLGFSKANNQALKKASSKYILVLNPDTKIAKDTIVSMINFMDKNLKVGIGTCRVLLANGKLDRDCRRHFPTPWRSLTHFSGISNLFSGSKLFDEYYMGYLKDDLEHEIDSCVGAFMFIRRSALEKIGLFDENFFFYGEDLDLCYRFKQSGYRIVYTPITTIIHYKGAASGMKSTSAHLTKATNQSKVRAIRESTRAMRLFYKKHYMQRYPWIVTWFIITTTYLVEIIRLAKNKTILNF